MFDLQIDRQVAKYLRRLDDQNRRRMVSAIEALSRDPFAPHTKALRNTEQLRSSRVGGWRIVYTVDLDDRVVRVLRVAPRGQVYRDL